MSENSNSNFFMEMAYSQILKEIEKWDHQPALQLLFSLEGRFGSGFFKFLANTIWNECPELEIIAHVLYPDVGSGIYPWGLGLYNSVEAMSNLTELTELTFIYDNQGLSEINELLYPSNHVFGKNLAGFELEWERNNQVIADYISDITSISRFPLYSSSWYK